MQVAPEVVELELLAERGGVPMSRALKKAGVAHTTYLRWKRDGQDPRSGTLRKVRTAISELAANA
jgi:hypothetical protein